MTEATFLERLGIYFIVFMFIATLLEVGLLLYAYIHAYKVECNLLWCTFTSEEVYSIKDSYTNITSTSSCFMNGEPINCSKIEKYINTKEVLE